ncbi:MAG: hypothetical protein ACOC3V_02040 [bacterium]
MKIKKILRLFLFLFYILIGVYIANISEEFFIVPEFIYDFNSIILFIGGILLIIGGINYLRISKNNI